MPSENALRISCIRVKTVHRTVCIRKSIVLPVAYNVIYIYIYIYIFFGILMPDSSAYAPRTGSCNSNLVVRNRIRRLYCTEHHARSARKSHVATSPDGPPMLLYMLPVGRSVGQPSAKSGHCIDCETGCLQSDLPAHGAKQTPTSCVLHAVSLLYVACSARSPHKLNVSSSREATLSTSACVRAVKKGHTR